MSTPTTETLSHPLTSSNHTPARDTKLPFRASLDRAQLWPQVGAAVLYVTYVLSLAFVHRDASGYNSFWDGWVFNIALFVPIIPIVMRAMRSELLRVAWLSLGAGVLLNAIGNLIYLFHDQNMHPIPSPAPSDVAYLASYVFFGIGIALLTQRSFSVATPSVRLDGAITGLAATSLAALLWFGPVFHASGNLLQVMVNMSYPVADLVLLVLLIAGLAPLHWRPNPPLLILMAGMISFVIGDIIFMNLATTNSYVQGTLLDATWAIGIWFIGLAAWPQENRRHENLRTLDDFSSLNLIPVIFGAVSVLVVVTSVAYFHSLAATFIALAAISLVILRMGLTQREVRHLGSTNFDDARTDELTGLMNRRAFLEDGTDQLAEPLSDSALAVLLIDLDGFKEVNDSIGHAAGDALLRVVAQRFSNVAGQRARMARMARIGGDEYACTIPVASAQDATSIAAALAETLSSPISLDGIVVRVSASVGVALFPEHGTTHAQLLRSADVAMYEAKNSRNSVCVYHPEHDPNSRSRLALIDDLRIAIETNALTLHYQPTLDLVTGQIVGVEALVRWSHPERGLLYPDEFIPLAERVGLIIPLTHVVLDLAIANTARLEHAGSPLHMSVNISRHDLVDDLLPHLVRDLLVKYGVAPSRLTLEVTESSIGDDPELARRCIEQLHAQGVRISIDDFGVGYSSMSQLLSLPVDELKIDRSFVEALSNDPRASSVIRSTVELAQALGLDVVAEGIETDQNLADLTALGADLAQGYFISHPLSDENLDEFLATHSLAHLTPRPVPSISVVARAVTARPDQI